MKVSLKLHFNRTIKELKLSNYPKLIFTKNNFNRTIKELKYRWRHAWTYNLADFNRTIKELKLAFIFDCDLYYKILIAPLRNWNASLLIVHKYKSIF